MLSLNNVPQAMEYLNQILANKEMHLFQDQALFQLASLWQFQLKDFAQAYSLYDRLLAEFPESRLAESARERLRALRQQHPEVIP